MKLLSLKCFLLLNIAAMTAWAHGEDKPGPHGGHIRMPGGFHIELMLDEKQDAHIFLLDMEFKNPTVKNSSIKMKFMSGKKEAPFTCSVMGGNHFHCVAKSKYAAKGELRITATREKSVGNEVIYRLPLEKFAEAAKENSHQGH